MVKTDPQIAEILAMSVEQYRELLQHAENLLRMLDVCDHTQMDKQVLGLQQLQASACQQDEQLLPLLKADLVAWREDTLYQKRLNYIESILKLNELLVPKILGIMAVASVELKKMHCGRTALAGYSSQSFKQHRLRGIG